jgi:DNA-binding CsgD family transcriptional regulator
MRIKKTPQLGDPLTPREQEVLIALCADKPTHEIQEEMGIARKTFHQHQAALQAKLGKRTRTGLVFSATNLRSFE